MAIRYQAAAEALRGSTAASAGYAATCLYVKSDIHSMMAPGDKPLVWLHGEIKTPPFSPTARLEAGVLLRRLQAGESLGLPHSRPMAGIGPRCHELRIPDATANWRIVYRLDRDAVLIVEVFRMKTATTPQHVVEVCQRRLRGFDEAAEKE